MKREPELVTSMQKHVSRFKRRQPQQVARVVLRRTASLGLALLLTGCPAIPRASTSDVTVVQQPYSASVVVNVGASGRPVNRLVLGTSVQWVDDGDHLLVPGTTKFDTGAMKLVRALAPTVIRYPGGSQGDTYHWRAGVGTAAERQSNELFFQRGKQQRVLFGTAEFLELCRATGAEPLLTVNATTGTAAEAAEWVDYVNRKGVRSVDGSRLPSVKYWELDNEPYLKNDSHPEYAISAAQFAVRANEFLRAMRKADPSIVIGIPMRSDTVGALRLPQQVDNYASTVLSQVTEPFDFVALHNTYFPFIWNPAERRTEDEVFRATMSASRAVAADFETTRQLLRKYKPGKPIKIAVTEFNALFAFGGGRESYIATLGGALYVADLLRLFAESDDVMLANFWSLSDNWYFGAVTRQLPASREAQPRPAYHVLTAFRDVLHGRIVPVKTSAPTFDSPAVGLIPAYRGTPLLASLATAEGDRVRVLLINKDRSRPASVSVKSQRGMLSTPVVNVLSDSFLYNSTQARSALAWRRRNPSTPASASTTASDDVITVPPHSLVWVEYRTSGR